MFGQYDDAASIGGPGVVESAVGEGGVDEDTEANKMGTRFFVLLDELRLSQVRMWNTVSPDRLERLPYLFSEPLFRIITKSLLGATSQMAMRGKIRMSTKRDSAATQRLRSTGPQGHSH
jgi:hypothetical protein